MRIRVVSDTVLSSYAFLMKAFSVGVSSSYCFRE
nr:MAG TPA: hypothetical protein [Caudoviricetes sp.]